MPFYKVLHRKSTVLHTVSKIKILPVQFWIKIKQNSHTHVVWWLCVMNGHDDEEQRKQMEEHTHTSMWASLLKTALVQPGLLCFIQALVHFPMRNGLTHTDAALYLYLTRFSADFLWATSQRPAVLSFRYGLFCDAHDSFPVRKSHVLATHLLPLVNPFALISLFIVKN